ncbi:MAG: TonB-dependent receptor [Bacteroidetes bacterium]|nr:TonB-dependent receptor [Bacteroidota bacterium]
MKIKRRWSKPILSVLTLLLLSVYAFSQGDERKITGKITDAVTGQPVANATIAVKGRKNTVVSNNDGVFVVTVRTGETVEISSVGHATKTLRIDPGMNSMDIQLAESYAKLDDVVVVGYGVQKSKAVTGATAHVKGEDLAKLNTTNALQALQGQAAGVNITSTSGQPGGGFKVNIRGAGTIGNANPLYVVDGVITSDITYLNPADIAAVDILKDAASAAIYGINGANGVVLITTKSGRMGSKNAGQVSFDSYYGWQNSPPKTKLLDAREYAVMQNEAALNSGLPALFTQSQINSLGKGTNWLDEMLSSNVPVQNYNLSVNGGSDVSSYSLGMSYTQQGGIVGGQKLSNYERYNFRTNSERKLYDGALRIGEHLTFSFINQYGIQDGGIYGNSLRGAFQTSPLLAMYDSAGNYLSSLKSTVYNGGPWNTGEANPYALMAYNNQKDTKTQKLFGDVFAELQPVKNLKLKTTFGFNYTSSADHSYLPIYDNLSVYSYNRFERTGQNSSTNYTLSWDNTANYLLRIREHKFDFLAGSAVRKYQGTYVGGFNTGSTLFTSFDRGYLSTVNVTSIQMSADTSTANRQTVTNSMSLSGNANAIYAQASFFGRINYSYKDKYLASAIFRADGSTMFAKDHQWGYFPSLSVGWVASEESFMASTRNWLNFLKLRASWGSNGNDGITAFNYLSLISLANAQYNFGNTNSALTQGSYPSSIGVEKTKWETSRQTNIGADAQLLDSKLSVSIDLYDKLTKDWLVAAPLLATAGVSTNPYINGGNVTNKGVELQLAYNNTIGKDFSYSVSGSYAYNQNKVNNIPTADGIIHGGSNSLFVNAPEFFRASSGNPIGYFWGYKTAGIFQTEADVQAWKGKSGAPLQPSAHPGDVKFVDMNGDGVLTADDKVNIGDPNPHHVFGFRVSGRYKNFDLSITTNGVAGNKIVQSYRDAPSSYGNWTSDILGRWHGQGTSNSMPRVTQNNVNWTDFSDLYIHDGSYWRISNITLGYDLAKLVKWKGLSQFRLYVAGENLFTFTKYSGMDPEIGYSSYDASGIYSFGQGVDLGYYPRPRKTMVGVSIIF